MIENRKYTRVSIKSVADVMMPGGIANQAYLGEISRGGLEMYTKGALQEDVTYTIKPYFLFEGHEMTETLKGKVKWSCPVRNDFVSGIEFTKTVTDGNHPNLLRCIEQAEVYNRYFFVKGQG